MIGYPWLFYAFKLNTILCWPLTTHTNTIRLISWITQCGNWTGLVGKPHIANNSTSCTQASLCSACTCSNEITLPVRGISLSVGRFRFGSLSWLSFVSDQEENSLVTNEMFFFQSPTWFYTFLSWWEVFSVKLSSRCSHLILIIKGNVFHIKCVYWRGLWALTIMSTYGDDDDDDDESLFLITP